MYCSTSTPRRAGIAYPPALIEAREKDLEVCFDGARLFIEGKRRTGPEYLEELSNARGVAIHCSDPHDTARQKTFETAPQRKKKGGPTRNNSNNKFKRRPPLLSFCPSVRGKEGEERRKWLPGLTVKDTFPALLFPRLVCFKVLKRNWGFKGKAQNFRLTISEVRE